MTKDDLINTVAKVAKTSKRTAQDAVNVTFENLVKAIKKDKREDASSGASYFHGPPDLALGQHRPVHRRGISSKTGYCPANGRKASVGEPGGTGKYRCTVSL